MHQCVSYYGAFQWFTLGCRHSLTFSLHVSLSRAGCVVVKEMMKETHQTIITDPETNAEKPFTFDYSYNSFVDAENSDHASQDTVWDDIGVRVSVC